MVTAVRPAGEDAMFYNYSLAGYFILLFVAFVATLNGLIILKTRTFRMPFGAGERVEGPAAMWGGVGLIVLGLLSLAALVWVLFR